ncbi:MAG: DUF721 domain-containing protein [Candidatus Eremiobacteraeota bacterium]|nr:DUF721 domain-containing protein [Candidatus Eremiobacteraeota bacterium]
MSLKPLKDATGTWTPAVDAQGEPLVALAAAWSGIVGKDIAQHSRPIEINGDTLIIATRSSAWTQQLSFLGDHVLRSIGETVHIGGITKIRFRVGRLGNATGSRPHTVLKRSTASRKHDSERPDAASLAEVMDNFKTDVTAAKRAKSGAAWKECLRCGVPVPRGGSSRCVPCAQAETDAKVRKVARLLFEAPWLGYAGIAALVTELPEREYESIRHRVLARWWETLTRAARLGHISTSGRERLIASSYVILKSGLDPEAISPAVVRNLLGDDLHALIYEISEK